MLVYECRVTRRDDGTVEAEPIPESARVEARRRVRDAEVEASSSEAAS
jgi:hypothetical protein